MSRAVIVLVSGLLTYDSGKTWFVIGLAKRLMEKGYSIGLFKPVAGHNLWSQYKSFLYSIDAGVLVGEDVMKYITILKLNEKPQIINPVDILMAPPDPVKYILNRALPNYLEDLDSQFKQIVLARYSECSSEKSKHYIFKSNITNLSPYLRNLIERFSVNVNAEDVSIESFIGLLKSSSVEENLDQCLSRVSSGKDVVIVESFNDAATPYIKLLDKINKILVIMPTAVAIYNDVAKAKGVIMESVKKLGETGLKTYNLLSYLPPDSIMYLRPRLSEVEYDEVFEKVL
ncbi:hypothetical protein QPL79_07320 [Ignisphaera sp. 4213-co]|uniref:ATPase n=1 Tax=Ignisphaera cupida TaxID=3050454 RepID=A0ABD4ZA43_9CREN|nr:hypothetical protein [Ignisphaera sp. 4213-co]MDK6029170.1 hypothetical protein [Ignisphaera sp. 4213-co]